MEDLSSPRPVRPNVSHLIKSAIDMFGSETKLASAIGFAQPSINDAKRKGRVGPLMALAIDKATEGRISKHELRPDLWQAPQ